MIQVQQHGSVTAIRMARTLLGRPIYWTTAYWLDGLLIDSGPPTLARGLMRVLAKLPVKQIIVTHAHEDHMGGLALLRQRYPDAPIFASPQAIPLIQRPARLGMQLYRRLLWGTPEGVADVQTAPLALETDQFRLRVIETPGHSRDHISLFETRHRWLFSGDAFIGGRDRTWLREVDMFSVISSLRALSALRPEKLFPGSGNVRQKAQPEIDGKVTYLLTLCRDVDKLDALKMPTEEIVNRLLGGETRMRFWTQGHFSGHNLVEACRAYNRIFDPAADLQPPLHDDPSSPSPRPSSDPSASREGKGSD